jgi:hypothetical protein
VDPFFVNVPVSVLVMAVGLRMLPPSTPLRVPDRTWFTESLLLSAAVATLLLALSFTASEGPACDGHHLGVRVDRTHTILCLERLIIIL